MVAGHISSILYCSYPPHTRGSAMERLDSESCIPTSVLDPPPTSQGTFKQSSLLFTRGAALETGPSSRSSTAARLVSVYNMRL